MKIYGHSYDFNVRLRETEKIVSRIFSSFRKKKTPTKRFYLSGSIRSDRNTKNSIASTWFASFLYNPNPPPCLLIIYLSYYKNHFLSLFRLFLFNFFKELAVRRELLLWDLVVKNARGSSGALATSTSSLELIGLALMLKPLFMFMGCLGKVGIRGFVVPLPGNLTVWAVTKCNKRALIIECNLNANTWKSGHWCK